MSCPTAASQVAACKRTAAALKMGLNLCLLQQDFVRYTIDCIIEMASRNRFAALADPIADSDSDSDEVPNQASTAEALALLLAPCKLINAAEAFGLQRLRRCYFPLQCQDIAALRRCYFPLQCQDIAVPLQTLAPSPSVPISPSSPPDTFHAAAVAEIERLERLRLELIEKEKQRQRLLAEQQSARDAAEKKRLQDIANQLQQEKERRLREERDELSRMTMMTMMMMHAVSGKVSSEGTDREAQREKILASGWGNRTTAASAAAPTIAPAASTTSTAAAWVRRTLTEGHGAVGGRWGAGGSGDRARDGQWCGWGPKPGEGRASDNAALAQSYYAPLLSHEKTAPRTAVHAPHRNVQALPAAPGRRAHDCTLWTKAMLLRVQCVCATATAAARHLASAPPRHFVGHGLQLTWAAAVLRRVFWGYRSRIRVCLFANKCACFRSCAHACCSIIWTL
jgi:hypothetical protein